LIGCRYYWIFGYGAFFEWKLFSELLNGRIRGGKRTDWDERLVGKGGLLEAVYEGMTVDDFKGVEGMNDGVY